MDTSIRNNPLMDITSTIARNITELMNNAPGADTIKKLSQKSHVGFGTVQRAKNGTGNITVQNLEAIACALGKTAIDLLSPKTTYEAHEPTAPLQANERTTPPFEWIKRPPASHPLVAEVIELMNGMDEAGKGMVTERARQISEQHGLHNKANTA